MIKKTLAFFAVFLAIAPSSFAQSNNDMPTLEMPQAAFYFGGQAGIPGNSRYTGEFIGGYTLKWDSSILYSLELFVGSRNASSNRDSNDTTPAYGARILPAYQLSEGVIFYGNIGYIRQTYGGIQLGLGLQTDLTSWFSLRGGYNWNRFKQKSENYNQFILAGLIRFNV